MRERIAPPADEHGEPPGHLEMHSFLGVSVPIDGKPWGNLYCTPDRRPQTRRSLIQIRHPASGALTIATSSGFDSEFLDCFAVVADDSSACGRAARQRSQTVIVDVNEDPGFAPHREIAAASGFRAVQSTPIVGPTGRLHGVISTHFRDRRRLSLQQMLLIDCYSERIGAALSRAGRTPLRQTRP